jgi:hypothetical protein
MNYVGIVEYLNTFTERCKIYNLNTDLNPL